MNHSLRCITLAMLAILFCLVGGRVHAEAVSVLIPPNASPRVQFGVDKLVAALKSANYDPQLKPYSEKFTLGRYNIAVGYQSDSPVNHLVQSGHIHFPAGDPAGEGFAFSNEGLGTNGEELIGITANSDSGLLYGCLEMASRIHATGKLPDNLQLTDNPKMTLRGTCIGMQKTFILPGRKVYEYPYTPELFPWFYDKKLWTEYLDFLVENRMNTLYLWSGHPFASLVRLKDYPYAVEVPDDVFTQNQEQFRWLAQECDKRGIWLVQMFYNILVSKPFADTNGIATQLSAPTPLVADYTRKSIAEFVKDYPNVGLMLCLGEALQGTSNQVEWVTQTILPGVLDGMKAAGLKTQPPVVIRTHAMDPEVIIPACFQVYSNLFTETKYNGESLTTWEPRGKDQQTHLEMAKLGPHLVNIHILSNLEPFRYGDTEFIRKSVLASRDRLGASGIHLYPLSYWNWPYSPDIADPPLLQWNRDWIWFEAWARYSWDPDLPAAGEHSYWVNRLAEHYGNTNAAELIYQAYNNAGEVAPRLIRRFGITEGNRQTLSLGMTLDQLVNPNKYGAIEDLWLSQSPPGERLDEFVRKEWKHEPHSGETPDSIIDDVLSESSLAVTQIDQSISMVTHNQDEVKRLANDVQYIHWMAMIYAGKVRAAENMLRYAYSQDIADMQAAERYLSISLEVYQRLAAATDKTYHYANSMQTSQRKIPVSGGAHGHGTNYLWSQLVPIYQKELDDFRAKVAQLQAATNTVAAADDSNVKPWPVAAFKLISTNCETYKVEVGAKVFTDRTFTLQAVAKELDGQTGIRFAHEKAKQGMTPIEFEATQPVQVLVGYFNSTQKAWLQVPKLEVAAQADERGGVDTVIDNAAAIASCPGVSIHAFRFEAGPQKLELIGKGSFVILGVVPQSVELQKRDAHLGGVKQ